MFDVLKAIFSRQWIVATILVVLAVGVMIRLGYWQIERLEQRRAFNARVQAQLEATPLELNQSLNERSLDLMAEDISGMEYRSLEVRGVFDHENEVALLNQAWENRLGVRLLTPLLIEGSEAVILVDRGWVPHEDYKEGLLDRYREPGEVVVAGVIRNSQTRPDIGWRSDPDPAPGERLSAVYLANVERIQKQVAYPLLPVYVQRSPAPGFEGPPHRAPLTLELTEGSHMGYAIQWFVFAAILFFGYPFFVKREQYGRQAGKTKAEIQNDKPYTVNKQSSRR
jgi:surfeit locus 1 family protein